MVPSLSLTVLTGPVREIAVTSPRTIWAPKRSAWARMASIRSGPMIPAGKPGTFSTSVVFINAPRGHRALKDDQIVEVYRYVETGQKSVVISLERSY
jgi:hypothetical protein